MSDDESALCVRVYDRITRQAENLVPRWAAPIESEFGVPIVNKRISVTPVALITGAIRHPAKVAQALDKAARETGVDFIGGYSALVHKGITAADRRLIESIPEALGADRIRVFLRQRGLHHAPASTWTRWRMMGDVIKQTAERTADKGGLGCAKLVVFCNAVEDNPFMAGAFHGIGEARLRHQRGRQRPRRGARSRWKACRAQPFDEVARDDQAARPSRSPAWASWWRRRRPERLGVPFGIVDLSLAPTPAVGDSRGRTSWRKWAWKPAARMAPPPRWPCSTTR